MERDIDQILTRGVGSFIDPDGLFKQKLLKKVRGEYPKDIVIKLGVDPNRPDIHLGHAVILRRLRQFQDLGCKGVFLVGDFTAQIGDPTGKSKVRPEMEQAEVEKNAQTYIAQVGKILKTDDPKLFSWIRNSDWFTNITDLNLPDDAEISFEINSGDVHSKVPIAPNSFVGKAIAFEQSRMQVKDLKLKDHISVITLTTFLWFLKHITHARLIERDMFKQRLEKGEELYMHEMMYPVLQGVDSFALAQIYGSCDLEVGGTDQTFNMLLGRDIMKANKLEPQAVLSMEIIPGTDGTEKMSKSLDNYIAITDLPNDMFGKVMSIPDSVMSTYYSLATYSPVDVVEKIEKDIEKGTLHPKDAKLRLAREITAIYHGEKSATDAEKEFIETFSNKGAPTDMIQRTVVKNSKLMDVLLEAGIVESKTEWRRLVEEGAVTIIGTEMHINSPDFLISENLNLKIGKRRFIEIKVN